MRLNRIQAGHYTCKAKARVFWPESDEESVMPVFLRIWFEDEWVMPAWALTIEVTTDDRDDHGFYLVARADVHSHTLRDMRATIEQMLTKGRWEHGFAIGWYWAPDKFVAPPPRLG